MPLVTNVRTAQVGVLAMHAVEHTDLRGIGHVTRRSTGKHIMPATPDEVRRSLTGVGRPQADKVFRIPAIRTQIVVGQFGKDHLPVGTLEPDVATACLFVDPHIEVAHAKAFGFQRLDHTVGTLEAVGLQNNEEAVGVHRLDPAHPLVRHLII